MYHFIWMKFINQHHVLKYSLNICIICKHIFF
uniref:Uncharacterized protein n=1 Tax=Anguilla anguilla TaxID=7936 RepID=A0A0E9PIQ8_ANGAN